LTEQRNLLVVSGVNQCTATERRLPIIDDVYLCDDD